LQEIASRLNLEQNKAMHYNFAHSISNLKDTNRLLIIDEAEYLRYETLELIRRIHDMANIGVLLVGLPRLVENLRGRKGQYAMLSSRIGVSASLENLRFEDTEQLVHTVIPDANGLCKTFHEYSNGNARVLNKLISRSLRVASINEIKVNAEVVKEASKLLIL
jgi:DNA transposition AAA+ family ATPase